MTGTDPNPDHQRDQVHNPDRVFSRRDWLTSIAAGPLVLTTTVQADTENSLGTEKWAFEASVEVRSSPTVVDGTAYVGTGGFFERSSGSLYAINANTGNVEWKLEISGSVRSSPVVAYGTVYVGGDDDTVYAVDTETGNEKWTFETSKLSRSSPTVANGTVYIGSGGGLNAIDADTGSQDWKFTPSGPRSEIGPSSPTVGEKTVYIGGGSYLYAVDADTGERDWRLNVGSVKSSPTVADGTIYVGSISGTLYAVDVDTGEHNWKFNSPGQKNSSPTVANGTVYVGDSDGNLYAIDTNTGEQKWVFKISTSSTRSIQSSPTVADGVVYVGSLNGKLYAVNTSTGAEEWTFEAFGRREFTGSSSIFSSPTVADGIVYVGSYDSIPGADMGGHLYAVNAAGSSEGSRVSSGTLGHNQAFNPTLEPTTTVQEGRETKSGTRITVSDATDGSEATPMEGVAVHLFNPSGIESALVPGEYSSIETYLDDLSGQDVLFDESVLELAQTKETDSSGQVSFSPSFRGEYRVLVEPPTSHPGNLRTVSLQADNGIGDTTDVVLDSTTHYGYLVSNNVRGGEYLRPDSSMSVQTHANQRIDTIISEIMRPAYGEFVRSFDTETTGYPTSASAVTSDAGEAAQGLKDEPIEYIMTALSATLEQELLPDVDKIPKVSTIVELLSEQLITAGTTLRYIIAGWGIARAKQEAYDENLADRVRRYGSTQNLGAISAELNNPGGSQATDLSTQDIEQLAAIKSSRSGLSDLTTSRVEQLRQGGAPENLNHQHILNAFEEFHSLQTNTKRTGSPEDLFPPGLLLTPNGRIFHTAKSESGFRSLETLSKLLSERNISSYAASATGGASAALTGFALVAWGVAVVASGGTAVLASIFGITAMNYAAGFGAASIGFNALSNVQEWNTREQIAADHLRTQIDALWDIEDTTTAVEELIKWFNDRTDKSPLTGEIDGTISFESVGDIPGGFANGTGGTLDANESITETGINRSRTGGINLKWTNKGTESVSFRIVTYGIRKQDSADTNDPGWVIEPAFNKYPAASSGEISPGETQNISIEYTIQNAPGRLFQVHMYKCVLFMEGVRVDTVRDFTALRTPNGDLVEPTEEPSSVISDRTNRESLSSEAIDDDPVAAKSLPAQTRTSGDDTKRYDLNVADRTVRNLESASEEAVNTQQAAQEYAPTVTTLLETRLSPGESVAATVELNTNTDTAEFLLIAGGTRRPEFQITGENLDSPLQPDRTSVTVGQGEILGRTSVTIEATLQEGAGTPISVFVPVIQTPSRPPLLTLSPNRFTFSVQPGEEVTRQVLVSEGGNQQPAEAVTAELSRLSNSAGDTLPSGVITVGDVPTRIDSGQDTTVTLEATIPDMVSLSDGPTRFSGALRVSATSAETVEVPISVLVLDTDLQHSRVLSADESVSAVRITTTQPTDPQSVSGSIQSTYQITVRGRGNASLRLPESLDASGYTAVRLADGQYQEVDSEGQNTVTGITLKPGVHEVVVTEEQSPEASTQPSETPTSGSSETGIFETVDEFIDRTEEFVDSVADTVYSIF